MPQRKFDRDDAFHASRKREEGQTMAEYSVVLAVITVASVAVFPAFGAAALNVVKQVTGLLP
jgi:Flp pilus assembly pilin Flp